MTTDSYADKYYEHMDVTNLNAVAAPDDGGGSQWNQTPRPGSL